MTLPKPRKAAEARPPRRLPLHEHIPMIDFTKTRQLSELFATERNNRNEGWRQQFYAAVVAAGMSTTQPAIIQGPDGFSYFQLLTQVSENEIKAFRLSDILDVYLEKGCGIVINPNSNPPDWVFTYGNLWSLKEFDNFEVKQDVITKTDTTIAEFPRGTVARETVKENRKLFVGQPSMTFFPSYARRVVKKFIAERFGVKEPSALLLADPAMTPNQSLVFSVFPEDFKSEKEYSTAVYRIKWFLPPHYVLTGIERDSDLAKSLRSF